jgi:hypothetical protein
MTAVMNALQLLAKLVFASYLHDCAAASDVVVDAVTVAVLGVGSVAALDDRAVASASFRLGVTLVVVVCVLTAPTVVASLVDALEPLVALDVKICAEAAVAEASRPPLAAACFFIDASESGPEAELAGSLATSATTSSATATPEACPPAAAVAASMVVDCGVGESLPELPPPHADNAIVSATPTRPARQKCGTARTRCMMAPASGVAVSTRDVRRIFNLQMAPHEQHVARPRGSPQLS